MTPQPLKEGSRWRNVKPSADEVAEWFKTVPLDDQMKHDDYISGVVLIPANEKVKKPNGRGGTTETWEMVYTPYVRVDTRIAYFRALADEREQIAVIEPVQVPRITEQGAFFNGNLPDGFWWHITGERDTVARFLCCTMRVALYDRETWTSWPREVSHAEGASKLVIVPRPVREGVATKQVTGNPDPNGLAKAETGAVGRALGMAGILVVGTGIATAEDMQELARPEQGAAATLPEPVAEETPEALNERLLALQARLREDSADAWTEFSAWWSERAKTGGWANALEAPVEVRRGMAAKMEQMLSQMLGEEAV